MMPTFEVSLPDKLESELTRLVEQGEYLNREQAVEDLLTKGLSAYDTREQPADEGFSDSFTEKFDDQQDPALQDDPSDDGYAF